jgi:hypothetical protein
MANVIYPAARQLVASGGLNQLTADLRMIGVTVTSGTTNYTYSAAHDFLDDVAAGAIFAPAVALSGRALVGGVLTAAPLVFPLLAVSGAKKIDALILYLHNATASLAALLAYYDTATGLPATPTGQDVTITWTANVLTTA